MQAGGGNWCTFMMALDSTLRVGGGEFAIGDSKFGTGETPNNSRCFRITHASVPGEFRVGERASGMTFLTGGGVLFNSS